MQETVLPMNHNEFGWMGLFEELQLGWLYCPCMASVTVLEIKGMDRQEQKVLNLSAVGWRPANK